MRQEELPKQWREVGKRELKYKGVKQHDKIEAQWVASIEESGLGHAGAAGCVMTTASNPRTTSITQKSSSQKVARSASESMVLQHGEQPAVSRESFADAQAFTAAWSPDVQS